MAQIEKILDLADRWDDTPFDQRGTPETFCQDTPELLNDFKKFLEQRNAFGQMLQGKTAKESPESLIGNLPSDRFELIRFHDAGGLGWVYLADDRELRRPVAIKCLQPSPSADPDAIKRFLREAEITAKLDHPGIVPIYGLSRGDGHPQPFYAMRFVEGETLRDAIRTLHEKGSSIDWKGVPFARLLNAYISICETIAFAHSRGVIHRDLKSLNIMLGPFGETLVMDWGLATKWNEPSQEKESQGGDDVQDESITLAGQAIGTVGYMSPEQARGDWNQVGPPSDQFALGAILYQLLTNQSPYSGPKALVNAKAGRFQRPRQLLPSIPRALEAICLKSMQAEPAMRYASVMDLKADIEQIPCRCSCKRLSRQPFGEDAARCAETQSCR